MEGSADYKEMVNMGCHAGRGVNARFERHLFPLRSLTALALR